MSKKLFWMLDGRDVWHKPCMAVARQRGYEATRITQGHHAMDGIGFIRPHADPNMLDMHKVDYMLMQRNGCRMIQDPAQVELYENKSGQLYRFGEFMPSSWRYGALSNALAALPGLPLPIVSKANEGASSTNIRVIYTRADLEKHIRTIFTKGIPVDHCSGGYISKQRDYVLLQEFIPHEFTWRVNRIGNQYCVFKRYNYSNKPVAQTGNTKPVVELTDEIRSLLHYSQRVTDTIGSKWVALDILHHPTNGWRLLETSLAWPVGSFNEAKFWHDRLGTLLASGRDWGQLWEVLFDELEAGAWD